MSHVTWKRVWVYMRFYFPSALAIASDFWRVSVIGIFAARMVRYGGLRGCGRKCVGVAWNAWECVGVGGNACIYLHVCEGRRIRVSAHITDGYVIATTFYTSVGA